MDENKIMEQNESKCKCQDINSKMNEMQEKMISGINQALSATAEKLDLTAEKMHKTADFFREKNADSLKGDVIKKVKEYPGHAVAAAAFIGFLFGKLLSR